MPILLNTYLLFFLGINVGIAVLNPMKCHGTLNTYLSFFLLAKWCWTLALWRQNVSNIPVWFHSKEME